MERQVRLARRDVAVVVDQEGVGARGSWQMAPRIHKLVGRGPRHQCVVREHRVLRIGRVKANPFSVEKNIKQKKKEERKYKAQAKRKPDEGGA